MNPIIAKIAPVVAGKLIDKVMEKSPLKRKGCGPQSLGSPLKKKGPCWEGYEMVGMKKKGGRQVPNCVPVKGGKPSPAKKKYCKK